MDKATEDASIFAPIDDDQVFDGEEELPTTRSRIFSGSARSRGTHQRAPASAAYHAQGHHAPRPFVPNLRASMDGCCSSAPGCSWADQRRTYLTGIAPTFPLVRAWGSQMRCTGRLQNQDRINPEPGSAKWTHSLVPENEACPSLLHATPLQPGSPTKSSRRATGSNSLHPADQSLAMPTTGKVSHIFTAEVAWFTPVTFKRVPPGHAFRGGRRQPLGMRAEHWFNWGNDAGVCLHRHRHDRWCCLPLPSFWTGHASCETLRRAPTTPHDVLLASARSESLAAAKKQSVMATAGHLQHSVGCPDGASKMIKSIQCFAGSDCSWNLVALDLKAAFQHVSSRAMLHTIEQHESEASTTRLCPYPRQQRH